MTNLEMLIKEDELCTDFWNDISKLDDGTWHWHICDFELLQKLLRKDSKWAKLKCKQYLKQFGEKRDCNFNCCDGCPHDRYVTINNDFILNISTCGISNNRNNWLDQRKKDAVNGAEKTN